MPIFYSKPAEIEAWLYDGSHASRIAMMIRLGSEGKVGDYGKLMVKTANGWVELMRDHFLIKGTVDFYPCDPVTFAARWSGAPPSMGTSTT